MKKRIASLTEANSLLQFAMACTQDSSDYNSNDTGLKQNSQNFFESSREFAIFLPTWNFTANRGS